MSLHENLPGSEFVPPTIFVLPLPPRIPQGTVYPMGLKIQQR